MAIDPQLLRLLMAPPKPERRNPLAESDRRSRTGRLFAVLADAVAPGRAVHAACTEYLLHFASTGDPLYATDSWLDSLFPKPPAPFKPPQQVKRKVYFAFDFDDLLRANNVRQVGKLDRPEVRKARSFYDRSIWRAGTFREIETLKRLMREGVKHRFVVCVLIGTNTWASRWGQVRDRASIIDQKGLLAVHINGLKHTTAKCRTRSGSISSTHRQSIGRPRTASTSGRSAGSL